MDPAPSDRISSPGFVALLTMLVALGQMTIGLYLPSLPTLTVAFDTTMGEVQLTLTAYFFGFAVSQLLIGPMSDRFGRRPVLFGGLVVFVAASLACAWAGRIEELVLFRFFQAFGACSGQALSRAIIRDKAEGAEAARVMSTIAIAMSISPALTPTVGAQVYLAFGWAANFVLLAVLGAGLAVVCVFRLPETNRYPDRTALDPRRMVVNYATLLTDRTFLGYGLALGFVFGALFSYQTGSPQILMVDLGYSAQEYGLLILFNVVGFLGGSILARRLGPRFGLERAVQAGCAMIAVSGLLMLGPAMVGHVSALSVIGPTMLLLAGMGVMMPSAMAGALQGFPRMAGAASALLGFLQMGFAGLGSAAVGALQGLTPIAMPIVFAVSSVLCLVVLLAARPDRR